MLEKKESTVFVEQVINNKDCATKNRAQETTSSSFMNQRLPASF